MERPPRCTAMFETVVIATDGSDSVDRAVGVATAFAARFDAAVHALYVIDRGDIEASPEAVRDDFRSALEERGARAVGAVEAASGNGVVTAIREGRPVAEINAYATEVDADLVAVGTRGRHGENRFLIGSVAERVVRTCPVPVLTVRHLDGE